MAKPGTTLPPSTSSFSIPPRPSWPSVKLSSTRGTAGRPGPTMGKLLPRQATTCLLSELSKRQDFAHLLAAVILGTEAVLQESDTNGAVGDGQAAASAVQTAYILPHLLLACGSVLTLTPSVHHACYHNASCMLHSFISQPQSAG